MRSHGRQLDLVRHGEAALAHAHRIAAETALRNPYETPAACARRAAHHLAEAARLTAGAPCAEKSRAILSASTQAAA
ncbi:hypothetical protein PQS31_06165 [Luteimonas sp BLCC-B24]|uniref:hypothetical protein n=1 Tax=Luteimonas sp. BLCC-B24 TaxID=3025317 RepID=UPI00234CDD9A|nr:hypothetical protein [Luteimonas sp. BLCC-B24]MDC7806408.1 hypothetical protein [Luteimonas sp. BLCC-B24]